jgi:hypothetical protein
MLSPGSIKVASHGTVKVASATSALAALIGWLSSNRLNSSTGNFLMLYKIKG